jgi:hypothetical protein
VPVSRASEPTHDIPRSPTNHASFARGLRKRAQAGANVSEPPAALSLAIVRCINGAYTIVTSSREVAIREGVHSRPFSHQREWKPGFAPTGSEPFMLECMRDRTARPAGFPGLGTGCGLADPTLRPNSDAMKQWRAGARAIPFRAQDGFGTPVAYLMSGGRGDEPPPEHADGR